MGLILDTSFVIAAEREAKRRVDGPALAFLTRYVKESFFITFTVAGELACGQSASALVDWKQLCRPFRILPWKADISWQYGQTYHQLQSQGQLIGGNDLWIAATAIVHGMPLVTNNGSELKRIQGLSVIEF